jgi:eukaryotic-like serine/threonine-protein kinase
MTGEPRAFSVSREQFLRNLTDSGLATPEEIQRLLASLAETGETDGAALARQLVLAGKLSSYQANAVLEGRLADLRIGAYEVLDLLGKGAMGTVYKARHRTMKRVTAIKVLAPEVARQGPFAQRFQREAETLAQLSHVNIIMAFDAGDSPAGPFLAMEFVQGRDLASEVKATGPLGLADALDCVLQAARGLEYAHDQGLVHRDIKPSNLLRDVSGVVKVADLGVARIKDAQATPSESALTQAGGIVGTVDYMAPEQALDSTAVDHRADIYSLGCTLFFLLTGRPVHFGSSLMGRLLLHRDAPPPSLREARPDAPESVNALFQRMVAKQPSDRYASMTEVALALEEACQSLGGPGPSGPGPRPAPRPGTSAAEGRTALASPRQLPDHGLEAKAPPTTFVGETALAPTLVTSAPAPALAADRPPTSPAAGARSPALPSPPQTLSRTPRGNRGVVLAGAALAGALIVAALIWGPFLRDEPGGKEPQPSRPRPPEPPAKQGPFVGVILNGGGSTFVNPLMQHWAGIYLKSRRVRIDYQAVGSGRSLDGVLNRVYVFGCSDAPLTDQQLARARKAGDDLLHVPLVLGAVVPAYNLPGVTNGQLRFTGPVLADIYLGKITHWSDPALKVANPGIKLPTLPITPVHRADSSGTTFIWTDYLSRVSGAWKARFGAVLQMKWPCGLEGQGNNGVADEVSRTVGSLGYLELSYALGNNLPVGRVKNRAGNFIAPSLESVTAAADALTDVPADLRLPLLDVAGAGTYPVVGATYALVHRNQAGNPAGRELVAFLRWATHEGQAHVKELYYAPLPPELVQRIDAALATIKPAPR